MRILNVTSSIDLKSGGGTGERTFQMSYALAQAGVQCTVLTLAIGLDSARIDAMRPASAVALRCLWRRFYVPLGGWMTIRKLVGEADLIHLIGHWSPLNALVYLAARRAGKPYVVCPAGALPLFGRSGLLKRAYNFLVGKAIVRNASAWIAVTPIEFPQFAAYGIPASKVLVLPNGVREDDVSPRMPPDTARLPDSPFILFMGRLNLIKGPDLLLEAFAKVSGRFPGHHLVFAGPDGGMMAGLTASAKRLGLSHRVHFLGHVDGGEKACAYRSAQLLVVPSRQEAMSIVALEAGISGTPVLLTDQCGFDEIAGLDPRLVVPASSEGLAAGLLALLGDAAELRQIGLRTRVFVREKYAWTAIITRYLDLYHRILGAPAHSMKLLVVSQYFWPENFIISDLVRKLAERGHEVVVATGKPNYPDGLVFPGYRAGGVARERFLEKVDVVRVPIWLRGRGGAINLALNYLSFVFSGMLCFPWLLRSRSFDAIVVFATSPITQVIPAILLKWLKRAHLAVWVQDMWPESLSATGFIRNAGVLKAVGGLVRWIYARSDTLLLQSRAFESPTAQYADLEKLVYFPNSVDPDLPPGLPQALPDDFSVLLVQRFCVVFAGNLGKAQSVETVVQAAVLLQDQPDICLVLVGSGSMLDWVQGQKALLKLDNLALPGRFPAESMPELFSKAAALLVTLKSGGVLAHTVPSKIQAYLAAGRPIVAALQGEGGKVVKEAGAGMVCEPENAQALADCIRRMHALPLSARDAMGQNGRDYFDGNFDMNRQVERLVEILQARRSGLKG